MNTAGFLTTNPASSIAFGVPSADTGINIAFSKTKFFSKTKSKNKSGFLSTTTNTSVFPALNNLQTEKLKDSKSQASNYESFSKVEDLTSSATLQPIDATRNIESNINEITTNLSKMKEILLSNE